MRKVLYILLISAFMFSAASAEIIYTENTPISVKQVDVKYEVTKALMEKPKFGNDLPALGGSFKEMPQNTFGDAIFSNIYDLTPIAYEPKSGYYFVAQSERFRENEGDPLTTRLNVLYTTDKGSSWEIINLDEKEDAAWVYPSIAVLNPDGSNDVTEMTIMALARTAEYDPINDNFPWVGLDYFIYDQTLSSEVIVEREVQPSNAQNYQWGLTRISSFDGMDKQVVINYGSLSPNQDATGQYLAQYGVYGVGNHSWITPGGQLADYRSTSAYPDGWEVSQFRDVTSFESSYNASIYIDFDEQGTAYAGVFNLMADNIDVRVPAVSKSTDNGVTWTTFETCPQEVLDNFFLGEGGTFETTTGNRATWSPGTMAYGAYGFAVTGPDEYSFVVRFNIYRGPDTDGTLYIVEVNRKDGVWSVNKIMENNYFATQWRPSTGPDDNPELYGVPLITTRDNEMTGEEEDYFFSNPRHLELQLSKTEDNNGLVVKYVDVREESEVTFNPAFKFNNPELTDEQNTIDTLFTTDIVMGYRSIDGDWNVDWRTTDDSHYYKMTWMPNIVPSFTEVPLMTSRTIVPTNPDFNTVVKEYPALMSELFADASVDQQGLFALVDLTDPAPLQDNFYYAEPNSVEDQVDNSIEIQNIYPNPATNRASVVFTTESFGNMVIALYDAQGNKVRDIAETSKPAGFHAVEIDNLNELASGTYYVTLTVNGVTISKPLNIVR